MKDKNELLQREIAQALGVSVRQAKRIEASAMKKLAALCRWYKIKPSDLRDT